MKNHQKRLAALVQWLRENSDKQTTGILRLRDCFCFEGAMCEVYRKVTRHGKWEGDCFNLDNHTSFSLSPTRVDNYFGARRVKVGMDNYSSIGVNDSLRLTFPQIADLIEVQWAEPLPKKENRMAGWYIVHFKDWGGEKRKVVIYANNKTDAEIRVVAKNTKSSVEKVEIMK